MSKNCIKCGINNRDGIDLYCSQCRLAARNRVVTDAMLDEIIALHGGDGDYVRKLDINRFDVAAIGRELKDYRAMLGKMFEDIPSDAPDTVVDARLKLFGIDCSKSFHRVRELLKKVTP